MNRLGLSLFTSLLIFTASCSKKTEIEHSRPNQKGLTKKTALSRKNSIGNLSYIFDIDLSQAQTRDSYKGYSSVFFKFSKSTFKEKNLSLDFAQGTVSDVYINGKKILDFAYNDHFINIPIKHFKEDSNIIKVKFTHKFSKTGSGIYKFQDKADKKVYLYSDFEPYDANLFAPIFDQPNLKASYTLNVKAPSSWTVVTSIAEQSIKTENSITSWSFPKSQKFSTYIFSMHAGPYKTWTDKVKLRSKEIPLKLYARQSFAKHVKPEFWFKITKQGFNFFEKYFNTDYPYNKYDQLIVPDFNSGAMENVAAVTFNEGYVSREKKPLRSQRRSLANVILHEMAHMWFGNLVTMEWWNDLWLNESFATYMAYTGLKYNTEYTESWLNFFNRTKKWAYSEDQWRTTHPIESDISSTEVATSNFDGITYGKGASSLKQLVFLIGEESFKSGLSDYFKIYAEKNTTRKNFIDSIQKHTTEDLKSWTEEWLQTKGLNTLQASFSCDSKNNLKEIKLTQGIASGDQIFRTHKIELAIWGENITSAPIKVVPIRVSGVTTTWQPKEETACPSAVFPNWNDYGYIQVILDKTSFKALSKNIEFIESKLFRSQFWAIIESSFDFGRLPPEEIFPIVQKQLPLEKDIDTLNSVLALMQSYKPLFYFYSDKEKALKDSKAFSKILKTLITNSKDKDIKKTLFDLWVYNTYKYNPTEIHKCLSRCSFDQGFVIGIDKKWMIAKVLSSVRYKNNSYVTALFKKDSSRRGSLNKLASEVRFAKNKTLWLDKALSESSNLSLKERNNILYNLIPYTQISSNFDFIQSSFFEKIDKISKLPNRVQVAFAGNFVPLFCGDHSKNIPITEEQIQGSDWNFSVKKTLLQSLDIEERCLKIKKASLPKKAKMVK